MAYQRFARAALVIGFVCLLTPCALASASRSQPLTLIVVPARYTAVQVGADIVQRHDALMIAYQGEIDAPEPILHVWDGAQWLGITFEQFSTSSYLRRRPSQVVLVGDEATLPGALIEAASLTSPLVMNVPTHDAASLINSFGKVLRFNTQEWQWFATRFNLELTDANSEMREMSWYDRPRVQRPAGPVVRPRPTENPDLILPEEIAVEPQPATELIFQPSALSPAPASTVPRPPAPAAESGDLPSIDDLQRDLMERQSRTATSVATPPSMNWEEGATATEAPLK